MTCEGVHYYPAVANERSTGVLVAGTQSARLANSSERDMLQNFVANKKQRQEHAAALLHAKTCQTVRQPNLFVVKWKIFCCYTAKKFTR